MVRVTSSQLVESTVPPDVWKDFTIARRVSSSAFVQPESIESGGGSGRATGLSARQERGNVGHSMWCSSGEAVVSHKAC